MTLEVIDYLAFLKDKEAKDKISKIKRQTREYLGQ
jgi:hypothetical protein